MHIKKFTTFTTVPSYWGCSGCSWKDYYAVHYKGFVASGPDLGACIAACHGAANSN